MLPIYFDHVVAGILDIRFNEAHAFQDREVRAYRLMAEQIEGALSHSVQHQPHEVAPVLTSCRRQFLKRFCSTRRRRPRRCPSVLDGRIQRPLFLRTLPILSRFRQRVTSISALRCLGKCSCTESGRFFRRPAREVLRPQPESQALLRQQQNSLLHQSPIC